MSQSILQGWSANIGCCYRATYYQQKELVELLLVEQTFGWKSMASSVYSSFKESSIEKSVDWPENESVVSLGTKWYAFRDSANCSYKKFFSIKIYSIKIINIKMTKIQHHLYVANFDQLFSDDLLEFSNFQLSFRFRIFYRFILFSGSIEILLQRLAPSLRFLMFTAHFGEVGESFSESEFEKCYV